MTRTARRTLPPSYSDSGPFSGYKPYVDGGGYSDAPNTVWSEGTWGALLFRLRRGEDVSSDLESMRRLQLVDPRRGLLQVTTGAAQLPYEFHAWPAVGGTAWTNLVAEDAGALWQPDGWNRAVSSSQHTDICGRVRDLVHGGRYSRDKNDWQSGETVWINHKFDEIITPDCSPAH